MEFGSDSSFCIVFFALYATKLSFQENVLVSFFKNLTKEYLIGEECRNEWCEPMSDEEYGKLK